MIRPAKKLAHLPATPYAPPNSNKQFLIKSLRADENSYFFDFVDMITPSATKQKKLPLRPYLKKKYTVDGKLGVIERATKNAAFTLEQKKPYSQPCATTLVTETVSPPVFGFDRNRRDKLVGVLIELNDALLTNRMYVYDSGLKTRPYDFHTIEEAKSYVDRKMTSNEPVLFGELESFKKALAIDCNEGKYNEVLARIRWNTDGSSKIFIGSDTLEARL